MNGLIKSPLLTDLYQLTMMQAYLEHGLTKTAVFEFFVRKLPPERNFLVAAGLSQVVAYLQELAFSDEDIQWLRAEGRFSPAFIDYLAELRFTGDVHAMAEGTVCFPNEPLIRITAPLPLAQLVESRVINLLHFQSLIASKAARIRISAPEALLVDFGMRRAHGGEAALMAARAAYIAGFTGTATVLAGKTYGIPVFGTMAHAFIQAHESEEEAFEHFAGTHPDNTVLLIDTYDTEAAAHKVVKLAARLKPRGIGIKSVRIDSGDLAEHAHRVRRILDEGGCTEIGIFASGNLDEYALQKLRTRDAPIDGYGVGTHLDVSNDAPALDCAYKLQEYAQRPRRKRSEGKATWAGRKQVYRQYDNNGHMRHDILCSADERHEGAALLHPVMLAGELTNALPNLQTIREYMRRELQTLPAPLRRLDAAHEAYALRISEKLKAMSREADRLGGI